LERERENGRKRELKEREREASTFRHSVARVPGNTERAKDSKPLEHWGQKVKECETPKYRESLK